MKYTNNYNVQYYRPLSAHFLVTVATVNLLPVLAFGGQLWFVAASWGLFLGLQLQYATHLVRAWLQQQKRSVQQQKFLQIPSSKGTNR